MPLVDRTLPQIAADGDGDPYDHDPTPYFTDDDDERDGYWLPPFHNDSLDVGVTLQRNPVTRGVLVVLWRVLGDEGNWQRSADFDSGWLDSIVEALAAARKGLDGGHEKVLGGGWRWPQRDLFEERCRLLAVLDAQQLSLEEKKAGAR